MKKNQSRGAPLLSENAWDIVHRIRALPTDKARFTLFAAKQTSPRGVKIVDNGIGPDSRYYIIKARNGKVPKWATSINSYVVPDETSFLQTLTLFADYPELFSAKPGDALDEAYVIPFDDEIDSWAFTTED